MTGRDWETQLHVWAAAPGTAEQQKIERAENEVREAIRASAALQRRDVQVFAQGSYRNRTNVPRESDVDICVRCNDTFFYDMVPPDDNARPLMRKMAEAEIAPATYRYEDYRHDLQAALIARFGGAAVVRGDKAFTVHETIRRVEADVVAAFEHRRYVGVDRIGRGIYLKGTEFLSDSGQRIINWPQQHYDNGVAKNASTRERLKAMVRVAKNLRNEMNDGGVVAADPIPSFFNECLVYNVADSVFGNTSYYAELRELLRHLYFRTQAAEMCHDWGEVNELKYLFRESQPWTREAGYAFILAAWRYVGFES